LQSGVDRIILSTRYRISSPISLVIFSVYDTDIWEIFHEKWDSAYTRGFAIAEFGGFIYLFFFLDNTSLLEGL